MDKYIFDYIFICFEFKERDRGGKKSFRFFNVFVDYEDFLSSVIEVWGIDVNGFNMYKFWRKL